jgi:hypothetical protein
MRLFRVEQETAQTTEIIDEAVGAAAKTRAWAKFRLYFA